MSRELFPKLTPNPNKNWNKNCHWSWNLSSSELMLITVRIQKQYCKMEGIFFGKREKLGHIKGKNEKKIKIGKFS